MPSWWTASVTPDWRCPVVVVAPGPSLTLKDLHRLALARLADRIRVVAVTDAVLEAWYADLCFAIDGKWWEARVGLPRFAGLKVQVGTAQRYPPRAGMLLVKHVVGNAHPPAGYVMSENSGAMAAEIVAWTPAPRIVLLGFDFHETGREHYFGDYLERALVTKRDMSAWVRAFAPLAQRLAGRLVNATPGSALDVPYLPLDEALA